MTDKKIIDFAVDCGIIDMPKLKVLYEDMEQNIILTKHFGENYRLAKGKDGRYFTRLPGGKQIRKANKDEFIKAIVDFYKDYKEKHSVGEVFYQWIKFKLKYDGISQGTYDRYEEDYNRFFLNNELADDLRNVDIALIGEDELEMFIRDSINKFKLTSKGWGKLRSLISGIWLYAARMKYTDLYITKFLDLLSIKPRALRQRIENESEQVFTDEESRMILQEINRVGYNVEYYGIALCFYTGMRTGEIAGLMWSDISDDFKIISVNHSEILYKGADGVRNVFEVVDHAKTVAGTRKIVLPDAVLPYIKELKDKAESDEYVFVKKGRRLHGRNIGDALARMCVRLGIPPRRLHKVRKTVCSKLCDNGVDERLLLKQIGHTDKTTTETYYHRDRRSLEEKQDIINRAIAY